MFKANSEMSGAGQGSSPITAVIFDLDGTLIDTEPTGAIAMGRGFEERGIVLTEAQKDEVIGRTWEAAIERLATIHGVKEARSVEVSRIRTLYRESLRTQLHVIEGAVEAVRRIAAQVKIGLVSGSHRAEIEFALKSMEIRDLFEVVLGAEDYPQSKPAPDGYLMAMKLLGVDPKTVLIFEDSRVGLQSARAAGAQTVLVRMTRTSTDDLSLADASVGSWAEVSDAWIKARKV